jgi:hypothetical protein
MLNTTPAADSWRAVLAITVVGWVVTFVLLLRARRRITYWL